LIKTRFFTFVKTQKNILDSIVALKESQSNCIYYDHVNRICGICRLMHLNISTLLSLLLLSWGSCLTPTNISEKSFRASLNCFLRPTVPLEWNSFNRYISNN